MLVSLRSKGRPLRPPNSFVCLFQCHIAVIVCVATIQKLRIRVPKCPTHRYGLGTALLLFISPTDAAIPTRALAQLNRTLSPVIFG
jgi:hypothetical protein